MSGTLYHFKSYRMEPYRAQNGELHTEFLSVDGDGTMVSCTTWQETLSFLNQKGFDKNLLPSVEHIFDFDLSLLVLPSKGEEALSRIDISGASEPVKALIRQIQHYLRNGEFVFFSSL
ncbi:hypothetical protein HYR99_16575 [Candidatus Poribacteria bacterium]|nr:hypothetical protein [Candidatus Poribacteria bacterium]